MTIRYGKYALSFRKTEYQDPWGYDYERWFWPLLRKTGTRSMSCVLARIGDDQLQRLIDRTNDVDELFDRYDNEVIDDSDELLKLIDRLRDHHRSTFHKQHQAIFTLQTLFDPENAIIDRDRGYIELHADIRRNHWLAKRFGWLFWILRKVGYEPWLIDYRKVNE